MANLVPQNFIVIRELAPVYRKIIRNARVVKTLELIRKLDSLPGSRNKVKIPSLILGVVKEVFIQAYTEIKSTGAMDANTASLVSKFGNEAMASTIRDSGMQCAVNSVLQNLVLSAFGYNKVGVLTMRGHVVPTVKLNGTTFVLDNNIIFSSAKVPTVREYVLALVMARKKGGPLKEIATRLFPNKAQNVTPEEISSVLQYFGGRDASIAALHLNYGILLSAQNKKAKAMHEFRKAIEMNPNMGGGYALLAQELFSAGKLDEMLPIANRAIELNFYDEESRFLVGLKHMFDGNNEEAKKPFSR